MSIEILICYPDFIYPPVLVITDERTHQCCLYINVSFHSPSLE